MPVPSAPADAWIPDWGGRTRERSDRDQHETVPHRVIDPAGRRGRPSLQPPSGDGRWASASMAPVMPGASRSVSRTSPDRTSSCIVRCLPTSPGWWLIPIARGRRSPSGNSICGCGGGPIDRPCKSAGAELTLLPMPRIHPRKTEPARWLSEAEHSLAALREKAAKPPPAVRPAVDRPAVASEPCA
jgi:hypothetical protein